MSPAGPSPEFHIAIAGGGLIGLSVAWRLAQAGFAVTLFEKSTVGSEASWAGAGMLAPGGEVDEHSPLAGMAVQSRALYPAFVSELERTTRLAIDYQECGALDLAFSRDEWQELLARAAAQQRLGVVAKPVTTAHVRAFWPRVRSENLAGAYFYPGDALVNPRELVVALAAACRAAGVSIVQQCAVTDAVVSEAGVTIECAGDSRAFAALVIAAGAWSQQIKVQGVPALPSSEPVKGHLIGYQQPEQTCNTILRRGHTYLLQRANGLLIAGASVEHVGFDRRVDTRIVERLATEAGFLLPHLTETTPTESWVGFRPGSDDLRLGAWHSPRIYLAYGHYRNGILLAPETAQIITREISASLRTQ